MINALTLSLLKLLLPMALTAYLLMGWLLSSGRLQPYGNKKDLEAQLAELRKGHKAKAKSKNKAVREKNLALNQWMSFGGGFYGVAALYTYAVIEVSEVFGFIVKLLDPANWSFDIGINLIINLFINSVMNFVAAMLWFSYWGGSGYFWINFISAYLGFTLGAKLATLHLASGIGHPQLWRWWSERQRLVTGQNNSPDQSDS